jgi:alkylresorcinol/alkylpyrone synthase
MAKIISVGTSDAKYKLSQNEIKEFVHNLFSNSYSEIERMIGVFDNSTISTRHISVPVDWLSKEHSFKERNEIFKQVAVELSKNAINECLTNVNADYSGINNIIFVTSTGIATPTIDAILFNELKLNKHITRTPLWGLGCAGGASAISKAMDYCAANPKQNAIVLCVELCSLTFQKDDFTKSNIIASSLFSDGCAAALICGKESRLCKNKGVELIDSLSTIYENSLDVMGWDVVDNGFSVVFSRDIPIIVKEYVKPNINELLKKHDLNIEDIKHYVTHPGGLKVINAYEESLALKNGALKNSRKVLNEHGNMSSPSVLYVMKEFLTNNFNTGEYGLLSALGPGFSSELVLFKTSA